MSRKTDTVVARTIGIDTGKNTLHLIGLDDRGAIVLREKLTRGRIAARLANVPQCLIGIEAGMATHCVARELIALGHDVKQVPPVYAKPFRQGHKNDFRDAHAIAEAVQRPSTRCVPVKTDDQLDLQALHRVRSRLISERTAVINQIRGFLLEHGIPVRQGLRFLRQQLPDILARRIDVLSSRIIRIIEDLSGDWRRLDERIEHVTEEIEELAHGTESCRQLMTIPGIGPIIASAMVAALAVAPRLPRVVTLPLGSVWCRSRCRQVIGRSLGASASAAIATCARCSCRAPALFCSDRQTGQSIALDRGSPPRRNGCITMFWQLRSPTSWRGSLGRSWRNGATTNRAS